MQFDFIGMQRIYLSLARGDAGPLAEALRERPALDVTSQWANFVRNHDELTLDKLSTTERQEVFAAFGPDPDMQLYGRGLRRRLPTMLGGDERRIRLVYSLMFSLPGTPMLFYGEEIGMGENLDVEGRLAGAHADAVGRRPQRRLLHAHRSAGSPARSPTACSGPSTSTPRPSARTPTRSGRSCASSSAATGRCRRSAGPTSRCSTTTCPPVLAHVCRCDDWRLLALHNLGADDAIVHARRSATVPEGSVLRDVLDGRDDQPLDPSGRVELRVDGHRGPVAAGARARGAGVRLTPP